MTRAFSTAESRQAQIRWNMLRWWRCFHFESARGGAANSPPEQPSPTVWAIHLPRRILPSVLSGILLLGSATLHAADCRLFPSSFPHDVDAGPLAVVVGDFNGDHRPDLATANYGANSVSLLAGQGNGDFDSAVTTNVGNRPLALAAADFNGDTVLDLAVANSSSDTVTILLGRTNAFLLKALDYPTGARPWAVAAGDFNGDDQMDLAVGNSSADSVSILLGNGDATFQAKMDYPVGIGPRAIVVGDFNQDIHPDLATANWRSDDVTVLLGRGDGTFSVGVTYGVGDSPRSMAAGDFNGDARLDLVVANALSDDLSILSGQGDGTFAAAVNYPAGDDPQSVVVADFNLNGQLDLAVASPAANTVAVLLGRGDGTFPEISEVIPLADPRFVTATDVNDDQQPDLAVANDDAGTIVVLPGNPCNAPPVAQCRDVTVAAGASCAAAALIEHGSFDPDGDPFTLAQEPPGPYPLGETPVVLTVTDLHGASDSCLATVTVVDPVPPTLHGAPAPPTNIVTQTVSGDWRNSTNSIATPVRQGTLIVDYEFYRLPDAMRIYYDGQLIWDTGYIFGAGSLEVAFGPGAATDVSIVMNEGTPGGPGTLWTYAVTIVSRPYQYPCLRLMPPVPVVTATDNCAAPVAVTLHAVTNGVNPMFITNTWTAADASGNATRATQVITIKDAEAPRLWLSVQPSNVVIQWPETCAEYRLQFASSLAAPIVWQDVGLPATLSNGLWRVMSPLGVGAGFYRLQRLAPAGERDGVMRW